MNACNIYSWIKRCKICEKKNWLRFDRTVRLCVVISLSTAGEPLAIDVRSPMSNGVLSPSSTPSSIGWDSRTPLIRNSSPSLDNAERLVLQLPSSPAASVDSLGGATDTTELDNYPWDSPDAATPLSMLQCATNSDSISNRGASSEISVRQNWVFWPQNLSEFIPRWPVLLVLAGILLFNLLWSRSQSQLSIFIVSCSLQSFLIICNGAVIEW